MSAPVITPQEFEFLRGLLYQHAALVLDPGKEYLVEARLTPLAKRGGFGDLHGYISKVRADPTFEVRQSIVEAMTIHETSFFRDWKPFEALRTGLLPRVVAARRATRELSIWSAACSTGQEPYSIAMLLKEHFREVLDWKLKIVATDVSHEAIRRAQKGRYSQLEINRGLPAPLLVKCLQRDGADWEVKDEIRKVVEFKQTNLAAAWPGLPPFDVIFLRNVLIYFNTETRRDILARARRALRPDGFLLLGTGETTFSLSDEFERAQIDGACCYQPIKRG
jgi:chemotaxis protein methyltransferase CheR